MNAAHARDLTQHALDTTCAYYRRWLLHNNVGKTAAMIFGKGSHIRPPDLTQNGTPIPWASTLKYLGLQLDPRLSFARHIRDTVRKAQNARGALLPLVRCRSSLSVELKLRLYNVCLRPIITYGSPVWLPFISDHSWKLLQRSQNVCVKHSLGQTKFSSTARAHELSGQPFLQPYCMELYQSHHRTARKHAVADIRHRSSDAAPPLPGQRPRPAALAAQD